MCGGVIGAISAILVINLVGEQFAGAGFFAMAAISFAAGSVGNSLIGGIVGRLRGNSPQR